MDDDALELGPARRRTDRRGRAGTALALMGGPPRVSTRERASWPKISAGRIGVRYRASSPLTTRATASKRAQYFPVSIEPGSLAEPPAVWTRFYNREEAGARKAAAEIVVFLRDGALSGERRIAVRSADAGPYPSAGATDAARSRRFCSTSSARSACRRLE